ncbi:hypothetical protein Q428_01355 [Fervidicella metallireducens AeB]|uniref:N-terminal cleavage protein n=1 Tax=Fervidicella metallireducens AeB TaxID=1403537 RepID=A0A017RY75_9CLOT|nr:type II secretion system protein [Fervidicella metallireducens]EYE89728.1 hypothetical protein Q428_01355 [Fervidicella metallireducens AeB]
MVLKHKNKGFTLMEVIISLAIITISVLFILQFFTGSFKHIVKYGKRTESIFEAQKKIDNAIANSQETNGVTVVPGSIPLKIYSQDYSKSIETQGVQGNIITVKAGDNNEIIISTFVTGD